MNGLTIHGSYFPLLCRPRSPSSSSSSSVGSPTKKASSSPSNSSATALPSRPGTNAELTCTSTPSGDFQSPWTTISRPTLPSRIPTKVITFSSLPVSTSFPSSISSMFIYTRNGGRSMPSASHRPSPRARRLPDNHSAHSSPSPPAAATGYSESSRPATVRSPCHARYWP